MERVWKENVPYTFSTQNNANNIIAQHASGWFEDDLFVEGTISQLLSIRNKPVEIILEGKFNRENLVEGKKIVADQMVMECHYDMLGNYIVTNFGKDQTPLRKTSFNKLKEWVKTEYYENECLIGTREPDIEHDLIQFRKISPETGRTIAAGYLICNHEIPVSEVRRIYSLPLNSEVEIRDIYNQVIYVGFARKARPHGLGRLFSSNGTLAYEGDFHEGKRKGDGKSYAALQISDNHETPVLEYEGEWDDDRYHGIGTLYDTSDRFQNPAYQGTWQNGEITSGSFFMEGNLAYEGDFSGKAADGHFFRHGKSGKRYHPSGQLRFEGDFHSDFFHGTGTVYYSDGTPYYVGNIAYGMIGSTGVIYLENGAKIEQQTVFSETNEKTTVIKYYEPDGTCSYFGGAILKAPVPSCDIEQVTGFIRQGKGICYLKNGFRFEGSFDGDMKYGSGRFFFSNGTLKRSANFKNDLFEGECVEYDESGNVISSGIYEKGKCIEGNGRFTLVGGEVYQGKIHERKRTGKAFVFYPNGKIKYDGHFRDNLESGIATSYNDDGTVKYHGEYAAGKYDGKGKLSSSPDFLFYDGDWKSGQKNGFGTIQYNDGSWYEGFFSHDLPHGDGKFYSPNGVLLYNGTFIEGLRDGSGEEYSPDGFLCYCGEWKGNTYHGQGILYYPNGTQHYVGGWSNGLLDGEAIEYSSEMVEIYRGYWKNGQYSGTGSLALPDGGRYEGNFANGTITGEGTWYNSSGTCVYHGSLEKGERHGQGSSYDDSGRITYFGSWVHGSRTGFGREYGEFGMLVYQGEFKDNLYHGKGQQCDSTGILIYSGEFKNGKRYGAGQIYNPVTGQLIFDGFFKDGSKAGLGILYGENSDIRLYAGYFKDDQKDGPGILFGEDNTPVRVGFFSNGKLHGRVNEIKNGDIDQETIYEDGVKIYAKIYDGKNYCSYEGEIRNGIPDGMGRLSEDGKQYTSVGLFKDGIFVKSSDQFTPRDLLTLPALHELDSYGWESYMALRQVRVIGYILPDNSVYDGLLENYLPNGYGRMKWTDGRLYQGNFYDGLPSGDGIMQFPDGSTYTGEFQKGEATGKGVLKLSGGMSFEGTFIKMRKEGTFRIHSAAGVVMQAEFINDIQQTIPTLV